MMVNSENAGQVTEEGKFPLCKKNNQFFYCLPLTNKNHNYSKKLLFLSSIKHFLSQNRHFANLNSQTECIESKGKLKRKPLEANAFRKKIVEFIPF